MPSASGASDTGTPSAVAGGAQGACGWEPGRAASVEGEAETERKRRLLATAELLGGNICGQMSVARNSCHRRGEHPLKVTLCDTLVPRGLLVQDGCLEDESRRQKSRLRDVREFEKQTATVAVPENSCARSAVTPVLLTPRGLEPIAGGQRVRVTIFSVS